MKWLLAWLLVLPLIATELPADETKKSDEFAAGDVLLALLSDEFDDGRELAFSFLNELSSESQRRIVLALLRKLIGYTDSVSQPQPRVVILAGNPRDESRVRRLVLEACSLDLRWKTFEKKQGGTAVEKEVVSTLRHADAVIIITGTASHILVQLAKDSAERFGVAWTCIDKASDKQVTAALRRLFPQLAVALGELPPLQA